MKSARAITVAVIALAATRAAAEPPDVSVTATNTGTAELRTDNGNGRLGDDQYVLVLDRLNVSGRSGGLDAQVRVDAFAFFNTCRATEYPFFPADVAPADGYVDAVDLGGDGLFDGVDLDGDGVPDAFDLDGDAVPDAMPGCVPIDRRRDGAYRNDLVLERISASARRGDWTITGGDIYRQLGRGIVLSIRKVDEAGLDVSLRGGLVEYRGQDHRAFVFAGRVNPANIDAVNQRYVEPVHDAVAGYEYELRAIPGARLRLFGAFIDVGERVVADEPDRSYAQGLAVELPRIAPWLSAYAEADVQHRTRAGESALGLAATAAATITAPTTTLLMESLWLDDFEQLGSGNSALSGAPFRYNQPPTLERIDQETLNASTSVGGRIRVEQRLTDGGSIAYASGNLIVSERGSPIEIRTAHGYAGLLSRYQDGRSRVEVSAGYRDETQTNLPPRELELATFYPGHRQLKSMRHAELDWLQAVGAGTALHVASTNEFRTLESNRYARGSVFLGVDRARLGGLTFELGYDTQFDGPGIRQYFFAGVARWEATPSVTLSAIGGTQRGGIKCVNGICREYPAFAGARVEAVARF